MEGSGGLSVSELLEQHSRTNIPRPVPPTDGRRPESTGRRAAPEAESTGRRARPNGFAPSAGDYAAPAEPTGRRAAPEPTGRRALPDDLAPADPTRHQDTGRRRRPTPEDAPAPHFGPESTGRRARPDLSTDQPPARRAATPEPPRRQPPAAPPRDLGSPRDAATGAPRDLGLPRDTAAGAPRGRDAAAGASRELGLPRDSAAGAPRDLSSPRDAAPGAPRDLGSPRDAAAGTSRDPGLPRDAAAGAPRDLAPGVGRDTAPRDGSPRVTRRELAGSPHDLGQTPPRNGAPAPSRDLGADGPRDPGHLTPRDLPQNGRRDTAPAGPRGAALTGPHDTAPAGPRDAAPAGPRDATLNGPRDAALGGRRDVAPGGPRETAPGGALRETAPGGPRDGGISPRDTGPRDLAPGAPRDFGPANPRDLADGSGPRRLAEGGPADTGRRPVDPRRANGTGPDPRGFAAPGRPGGPDGSGPRRLAEGGPDGSGPRRLAEGGPDGSGPRRLAEGGPDGSGPRRLAEGGPDGSGPRRLAEGPGAGRRVAPGGPDGSGPRRLAEGGPDGSGPRRLADGAPRSGVDGDLARGGAAAVAGAVAGAGVEGADIAGRLGGAPAPSPRDQIDPLSLTTEMEAISDEVKKRREVDHTLARFSAVHDELAEQERQKKERRQKLLPWKQDHDEDATVFAEPLDDPDDPDTPRRRKARTAKHSKIVRIVKVLSLTGAVLVFVATGLGWGAMQYIDSKFTEIDALNTNSAAVHQAEKQLGDENFLIVGSDTRAGAKPEDGVGDADAEPGARSDVLMLAHIPADRKRVVVVSVPRDLQITRPECEKWNWETGEYTGEMLPKAKGVKANQAYADGGPRCVSTFMTELTGLTINHFISVDFNGFKGMVDAVGKIKVCVPKVMEDEELGMIFDKPGQYEIDGAKALDYVRARKVTNEPLGDYDRVKRQQKFLSSLLRTALSSEMLLNPGKLNNFLNAFAASTVGQNIGVKDMLTLAQSLQGIEAGRVSFITVPHRTDEGPTKSNHDNIELLLEDETKALFQAIIDGTPLPGETPDATPTTSTQPAAPTSNAPAQPKQGSVIDPKGLKIQVFNGEGGRDGAAKLAKDSLEELGFSVVNWGGGEATPKTVIRYGIGGEDAAATLAAAVPGATPEFRPEMGGSVLLLLGPEWDRKVVAPQPGGTQGQPGKATPPPVEVVNAGVDPCA